jgi:hypothetical protein
MKIRDIVVEVGPVAYEKGKSKMDKVLSPSKWLDGTNAKLQYDTGKDKMDKLLTPSRWFEPSGTNASKTKSDSAPTDNNELKTLIDQTMSGKSLDTASLQKLRIHRANISDDEVGDTVDKVLRGSPLDSQDLFALKSYRNTL